MICFFFFQAEDGIRDLVRSRGLGDVYKRQPSDRQQFRHRPFELVRAAEAPPLPPLQRPGGVAILSLIHI